jgi:hypothetical protein
VALAIVEHVLGAVYAPKRGVYEASHLGMFRRHVWRMMATYLGPDERPIGTSGFAVAQALRKLDKRRRMDLCQDLFCGHERSRRLLIGWQMIYRENQLFRDAVLGKGVTGLYQLNRRDRSKASWAHQVRLLESVNDNLDCIFLHFRAVVCEILIW